MKGETSSKIILETQKILSENHLFFNVIKNLREMYQLKKLIKNKNDVLKFGKKKFFFDVYYNYKFVFRLINFRKMI